MTGGDDSAGTEAGSQAEPAFAVRDPLPDGVALWLIRHGETEWSRSGQHTGRTDIPLTQNGVRQATALRDLAADLEPAFVLSSPLERARVTADLAGLSVDGLDDDLMEWDYGDYEGLTTPAIREEVPGWSLWTHGVPNGESAEQVKARADRVLNRAAEHLALGPVVLVAHGHICRVMGARWIGLDVSAGSRLALRTAAPSMLSSQYGVPVIDRWNMPNPATMIGDPR
jgi:probable phosphoglycerate mutase